MNAPRGDNPYAILGVSREATEAEIKRAYFTRIREHPPERDPEGFKQIRAAYEQLRAPEERAEADLFLIDAAPGALDPDTFRGADVEPAPVTLNLLRVDLVALEAALLFEAVAASARGKA